MWRSISMSAPLPSPPGRDATQEELDSWIHAARMQKITEAQSVYGSYKLMHFSALSSTTRKSHAERHGKLYTAEEVIAFWNDPANRVGCKCSIISVLVDSQGNAISSGLMLRAKSIYDKMNSRHGHLWI